jgi:hypothetical protein
MCTLRTSGADFDVDAFLATSSIKACAIFHAGEPEKPFRPDGPRLLSSVFNADVSKKEWDDLSGQIEDAKAFLKTFDGEIRRLAAFPGCEGVAIDFPINLRIGTKDTVVQWDTLPSDLLLLAGTLGVDIMLTLYPPSTE